VGMPLTKKRSTAAFCHDDSEDTSIFFQDILGPFSTADRKKLRRFLRREENEREVSSPPQIKTHNLAAVSYLFLGGHHMNSCQPPKSVSFILYPLNTIN